MNACPLVAWWTGLSCCFMLACQPGQNELDQRRIVATIDGAPIYADDFSIELGRLSLNTTQGLPSAETQRVQKQVLLDDLVNRRLLLKAADAAKVVVGMDGVEAEFRATKQGWKERRTAEDCDDCSFDRQLTQQNLTAREFRNHLRDRLLIRKYFREHVFARIAVTDAEIEAALRKNPELSVQPEMVRAKHIVVKSPTEAKQIERELRGGLSFEDAAMKYSHGPQAKAGGDLGFFRRGIMPTLFDDICFALEPNKVSKPVTSEQGVHLFKVEERREAGEKPFKKVKNEVEATIRQGKEHLAEAETIKRLRASAKIEVIHHVLAEVR